MNKIKKAFLYLTGLLMALVFKVSGASAQVSDMPEILYGPPMDMYGPAPMSNLTWWEKILAVITSPITITILILAAITIGIVVLIKRKKKNAKKTL